MQKILGTGLTGLIGTRITKLLPNYDFISVSRSTGVDISDLQALDTVISQFEGRYVLHMAAKADVDGCEADKALGENGEAWKINVIGAENIAHICRKYNKKIIYISTDFVFDGKKEFGEFYTEDDIPSPINWYGNTKYEGEKKIIGSGVEYVIMRIAYPYGISDAPKKDFVRIIANRLLEGKPVAGVTDHIMCPTYIDDIARALDICIQKDMVGLIHVVGSAPVTPYDAIVLIAEKIGVDTSVIGKTTREEYFKGKAVRPFNLYLKNDKINSLGLNTISLQEGINLFDLKNI